MEQIVDVDESGIEETIHREYARAPRGQSVKTSIMGRKTKRINMRAGLRTRRLLAPCLFEGNIDTNVFNAWLEQGLLKELHPRAAVIMDNASFHKSAQTRQLLESAHCQLIFLPTDSPDLNRIENHWAILQARVKKALNLFDNFYSALCHILANY